MTLYGFPTREERETFELLLAAVGVGPTLALKILSVHAPSTLAAAVADQDEAFEIELLAHLVDLREQGLRIAGVAFEHRDRHGDALRIGQQAVVDLAFAFLAVAVVAERRQWTRHPLEVA